MLMLRAIVMLSVMLAAPAVAIPPPIGGHGVHGPLSDTVAQVPTPRRKSIRELSAAELESLRRGFAQMIAWNNAPRDSANFRRSLAYWANIHAYFGVDCADPDLRQGVPGMEDVPAWPPVDLLHRPLPPWCQCEHGSVQFLTWHRMYLYYFERVLQAAARDPNLRLPYWDYNRDGHLPAAYRAARWRGPLGILTRNPLRVEAREASLNSGAGALDPDIVDTSQAMSQTRYAHPMVAIGFTFMIEQGPHNPVHCAVGVAGCPSGLMGSVPASALDPIFYAHHTNIDRLYDCWLGLNDARLPQGDPLRNQEYSFVDGDGSIVRRRVGDMLTSAQLGYSYSAGAGCPTGAAAADAPGTTLHFYPLHGEIRLERGLTAVPLAIPAALRTALRARRGGVRPHPLLVLDGLSADRAPGVMYKLRLQSAGGRGRLIGVLSFFDSTSPHIRHGGDASRQRVFDLGALPVGELDRLTLVIEPATGLSGSTPAMAARRIDPRAAVRFASARIALIG